ncbi:MAG TPA: winged helix-turn-helix domain-containing protein, partial [Bryobacteraceae bacterium]|nr:winged helix-turn-helix domain-containing protein [Bryobacteraceae bacterium]
ALLEAAWPGKFVEESNLAVQIAALRKALGTQQSGQEWIVTVPRLGYRLPIAAIPVAGDAAGGTRRPMLAVLPFEDLSPDRDQEYLADGLVEDITTALSHFRTLAVVSRNSAHAYKGRTLDVRQVGKELGVRYLLEGAIRAQPDRVRLNVQLVETETGTQLWSRRFDGPRTALFETQDQITQGVVAAIQPNITRAEVERARRRLTSNPTAYDLYLRALPHLFFREGRGATDLLEEALRLDPDFYLAAAYAGQQHLSNFFVQAAGDTNADRDRGQELLNKVLPHCGEDATLLSLCAGMFMNLEQFDQALELALRAVTENPNDAFALGTAGVMSLFCGELQAAADYQLRALSLSPNEYFAQAQLACVSHIRLCEGRPEEAIEWALRSLAASPHWPPSYWLLAAANAHLGRIEEARRYVGELLKINPSLTVSKLRVSLRARDPSRVEVVIQGLRLGGLPEN